jgi:ribonucleotide reductase class II
MFNSVNEEEQLLAIEAGALWALLMMDTSREDDPGLAIGLTGVFDFFVRKFGRPWLEWWAQGRVRTNSNAKYFLEQERLTLGKWFSKAKDTIETYCIQHGLRMPTRFTCTKHSTHSLTNASPGWLPPTATRYIRRLKYCAYHPVALACIDYGYNVVCSPDCTDEQGRVFRNIYNDKATEWVVEIPVEVPWSDIAEGIDLNFSAIAQLDFYKVLQTSWSNHQSACMIRAAKAELEALAACVYESIQYDQGFVSIGINNEPNEEGISRELYNFLVQDIELRRTEPNFFKSLKKYTGFLNCSDFGLASSPAYR